MVISILNQSIFFPYFLDMMKTVYYLVLMEEGLFRKITYGTVKKFPELKSHV